MKRSDDSIQGIMRSPYISSNMLHVRLLGLVVASTSSNADLILIVTIENSRVRNPGEIWTPAHRNLLQWFKIHRDLNFSTRLILISVVIWRRPNRSRRFSSVLLGSARLPRARGLPNRSRVQISTPSAPHLRRWRRPTPAACSRRPRLRRRSSSSSRTTRWRSAWCGCPALRSSPTRPRCSASTRATSSSRRTRSPAPTRPPPPTSSTASSTRRTLPPPSLGNSPSATASSSATPPTPSRYRVSSSSPSHSGSLPPSQVPIP